MTPETMPLGAVEAELDQATRQAGKDLLLALLPTLWALLAWLGLRRQRAQIRSELANPPDPEERNESPGPGEGEPADGVDED